MGANPHMANPYAGFAIFYTIWRSMDNFRRGACVSPPEEGAHTGPPLGVIRSFSSASRYYSPETAKKGKKPEFCPNSAKPLSA
jgi:hypothetical protein